MSLINFRQLERLRFCSSVTLVLIKLRVCVHSMILDELLVKSRNLCCTVYENRACFFVLRYEIIFPQKTYKLTSAINNNGGNMHR